MSLLRIETPRLMLRPAEPEDAAAAIEMDRDPEIIRFMMAPQLSEADMVEAIRRQAVRYYEPHELGILVGILKSDGSFVGRYGLQYVEVDGVRELEVKYLPLQRIAERAGFRYERQVVRAGAEVDLYSMQVA